MSEEYEVDFERNCPKCGHNPIHYRDCMNLGCDEGYFDESDDDPINFFPGEMISECSDCHGTGVEVWCPACGANLSGIDTNNDEDE